LIPDWKKFIETVNVIDEKDIENLGKNSLEKDNYDAYNYI
jgi:hypothetical protein